MEIYEFVEGFIDVLSVQAVWFLTIIERVSSFIDTILVGIVAANAMDFRDSRYQIMVADELGLALAAMHMVANKVIVGTIVDADMADEMVVEEVVDRIVDMVVGMVADNNPNAEAAELMMTD